MNTPKGPLRRFFSRQLTRRHGGMLVFFGVFLALSLMTRVVLLAKAAHDVTWTLSLVASFAWGLLFDLGAAAWASLPLLFVLTFLPSGWFRHRWQRWLAYAGIFGVIYLLLFGTIAEWVFWDEFGVRFNFIAVDYLVYTTEVIGNIRESYNLPFIFGGLTVASALAYWLCWRTAWLRRWAEAAAQESFRSRLATGAIWFAGILVFGLTLSESQLPAFRNNFNRELGKDGLWSLFAAFKNNEIDYDQFYRTRTPAESFKTLNSELVEDGSILLRPGELDTLRYVSNEGVELKPNIIQITVESLSADFLSIFNRASNLTPNLAEIAAKSLNFDNFYATGTRTDRGMEALTLSMPPTPGRSIVKRPRNENLFTLGSVFRSKGYDTAFIYGGFGYFDNMNYFFGNNGYRVIDRTGVAKEDVTFANVWGVCDEDLFRWTLREADASAATGKPFHYFVMTTSNHRPYTFPEGRIDLPSKISGRAGAVKYTDYAIGKFLRDAESKPWFKNTVFVIVADHCASSAGRTELPVQNYHIPLMIYAPGGHIAPGHIKTLTSQMDYAPTLLGLLNWSYPSRFFGHDVRKIEAPEAHALLGNYQKLGHIENGDFVILKPQRGASVYRYDFKTGAMTAKPAEEHYIDEAISFYEAASYMYKNGLYRQLTAEEEVRYTALARKMKQPSGVAVAP